MAAPQRIIIACVGSEEIDIYVSPGTLHFRRKLSEPITSFIPRFQLKCRQDATKPVPAITFSDNLTIIQAFTTGQEETQLTTGEIFSRSRFVSVGDDLYTLIELHNLPTLLRIDQIPMINVPMILGCSPPKWLENCISQPGLPGGQSGLFKCQWYEVPLEKIPLGKAGKKQKTMNVDGRLDSAASFPTTFQLGGTDPAQLGTLCGEGCIFTPQRDQLGKAIVAKISHLRCSSFLCVVAAPYLVKEEPPRPSWNEERYRQWPLPRHEIHCHSSTPSVSEDRASTEGSLPRSPPTLGGPLIWDGLYKMASWNILAPVYASSDYAAEKMFPNCPERCLQLNYRKGLILQEILRIDPDILFLQEVGREVYDGFIAPMASVLEMDAWFARKLTDANEGVAICTKKALFEPVETKVVAFKEAIAGMPEHQALRTRISQLWPDFMERNIPRISGINSFVAVRSRATAKTFILGNTHFFWHPLASHIRALQALVFLTEAQKFAQGFNDAIFVLAGDFNADDNTATLDLLEKGKVPANHVSYLQAPKLGIISLRDREAGEGDRPPVAIGSDNSSNPTLSAAMNAGSTSDEKEPSMAATGPELVSPISLKRTQPSLAFTNNIGVFHACLDWIFTSPAFETLTYLPEVSLDSVTLGLPTDGFPSDHLPIAVLLKPCFN